MRLLVLVILLSFCCSIAVSAADAVKRTYKIGTCPWIAWAPINIADVKGMWKKRGVDVQVVTQLGEDTGNLEQRRVDLAIDMIGNFIGIQQKGIDVSVLGELDWSNGGDKIISRNKLTPTKAGDTIGVYHNDPAVTMLLVKYLQSHKLTLNHVKVVEYDPEALNGHFILGAVSTIISYEPFSLQAEKDGGFVVATSASFPGCMPEGLGGLREVIASIPKEDLKNILAGWIEAVDWSRNPANWVEYCAIVNKHTFAEPTPYDSDAIKEMLTNVSIHDNTTLVARNSVGGGLPQYIDETRSVLSHAKMLKSDFSASTIVDTTLLQAVLKEAKDRNNRND